MAKSRRAYLVITLLSAVSVLGYLLASHLTYRLGFPLDDAWIHQTYARNLATRGEWAFLPGQLSAGSTAPLWSLLLAPGQVIRPGPYAWTYFLGWLSLAGIALLGMRACGVLCPERGDAAIWAGIFLCLEWHLVWAAASGMETLWFAFFVLLVLVLLACGIRNWMLIGLLVGLSVWLRPDGITLAGPVLLVILAGERGWRERGLAALRFSLGVSLLLLPYLAFNTALSGKPLPSTFFAKQAEYAVHRQVPLWGRLLGQAGLPLVGAGALLAPGFLVYTLRAVRVREWAGLAAVAWVAGYLALYAIRLPVTYQHGRYVIPAMAVYFVYSLSGMACWIRPRSPVLWQRVASKAWPLSTGLVLCVFWLMGARAYAGDVAIIESEMVVAARWIASNTDPQALVAVHDIGALGYFGERQILDLAGLVSPQVIPFIRDESRLEDFLNEQGAQYLVTFPGWYPTLVRNKSPVFSTRGGFSPAAGGENMNVYRWTNP